MSTELSFGISDEQSLLLESAERFVREHNAREPIGTLHAKAEPFCRDRWRAMADLGWLALVTSDEFGGVGGSAADLAVLMRGLGPAMLREPLISSSVLAATLIEHLAPETQRQDLLEQALVGDTVFAVVFEEFACGLSHAVVASEKGQGFSLSGSSLACWNAPGADALLVMARMAANGERGLFLLNPDAAGLSLDPYPVIDGSMAADVHFDQVEASSVNLLATGSAVDRVFEEAVDKAIIAHSAKIVGILRATLDQTSEFLKTREQFGSPISRFQALQHRVAEMFVRYQDATAALEFATRSFDNGNDTKRQMLVSAAKVVIAEAGRYIGSQGIQLHGAIGVTEEYQIGHYYRNVLFYEKMYGDTAYHLSRYQKIKSQQD